MAEKSEFKAIAVRLKHERGITLRDVANTLGMNYSYLSDVSSGRSPFTDDCRAKMIRAFGAEIVNGTPDAPTPVRMYGGEQDCNMVTLPLIPIDAVAGFPTIDNDGVTLADCEQYAIPEFTSRGAEFLVRVSGTSMYPRFNHGDLLACKRVQQLTFVQWGMVYVLDTEQGMLVKRLYECPDDRDSVVCHSENTNEYTDFRLPKTEIRSVSIVLGHISVS